MSEVDTSNMQKTEPKIKIHNFSEVFMETPLFFHILFLKDSYFVWVGTSAVKLDSLFAAAPSPYGAIPSTSQLIGNYLDTFPQSLGSRLSKRFGKMFFVSASLPDTPMLQSFAEKKLVEALSNNTSNP